MGTDVEPTKQQVQTALNGIMMQLETTGIAEGYDSMADALHSLGMWDFIMNQANVIASLHAFSVRDNNIIQKLTMAGAYVKLPGVLEES